MTPSPILKPDDIELIPDAWERFERAIDTVSKSGPQHRAPRHKVFEITDDMRVIFASICDPGVEETPAFAQACLAFEELSQRSDADEQKDS